MVKGKWKRKIYFGGGRLLSALSHLVPKDANRVCFFCKSGLDDNSEALFRHMIDQGYPERYRIFCIVDDPDSYRKYEERHVAFLSVRQGLWQLLRSRYLFCHGEMLAVMPTKKQISVNYWHGTPLKKINGMLDKLGDYKYDFFTYITAAAPMFRPVFAEAFGCRQEQVILSGHPRNDYLFRESQALEALGVRRGNYEKIYLWMPTYRKSRDGYIQDADALCGHMGDIPLFQSVEELGELNQFLENQRAFLFLKMHPAQNLSLLDERIRRFSNVCFLTNEDMRKAGVPLYSLVREADALITDYSSVYFDYLLLNRPIGFVLADMDSYEDHRGFVVRNPLDYMPGMKIYRKEEFYDFLSRTARGQDGYEKERRQVNDRVNYYQDGENCERLLEMIQLRK